MASDLILLRALVESRVDKPDTEGVQGLPAHLVRGERGDLGGVQPPAEVGRNRDVGPQSNSNLIIEQRLRLVDEVTLGSIAVRAGEVEIPPTLLSLLTVRAEDESVRRR